METTTTSAYEIDISDQETVQFVLDFLDKHSSESLRLGQFLKNLQEKKVSKEYLWPHQLFVNDRSNIRCVLLICSSIGFRDNFHLMSETEKSKERSVSFFCGENDEDLLMSLIEHCLPWSTADSIVFSAFPHRFSLIIEEFIQKRNLGKCRYHSFQQLELDKETLLKHSEDVTSSIPSNIIIQPLTQSDTFLVNDFWTYKSEFTLDIIKYEIDNFPAFGAYRDGKLLSWALTKYDGSIGTVFTQPEARGLGLGAIVNFYTASKLLEQQQRTFAFVASDNVASLKMLGKLGYCYTRDVYWLIFSSK